MDSVLTIWAYENSVARPPSERVTGEDSRRHLCVVDESRAPGGLEAYAVRCDEYLRFGHDVDEATSGVYEPHDHLKVCDTPEVMLRAGFAQLPMLYTQQHLLDAIRPKQRSRSRYHGLTIEEVKRLPELLETPVLMCDNPARADAMLLVLADVDPDGLPLIASVKPDGFGRYRLETTMTNMVLTVFGRASFGLYFKDVLTPERVIYYDPDGGQRLERLSGSQLTGNYSALEPRTILHRPECLARTRREARDVPPAPTAASLIDSARRGGNKATTQPMRPHGRGHKGGCHA